MRKKTALMLVIIFTFNVLFTSIVQAKPNITDNEVKRSLVEDEENVKKAIKKGSKGKDVGKKNKSKENESKENERYSGSSGDRVVDKGDIEEYRLSDSEFNELFKSMVKDFINVDPSDMYFESVYKGNSEVKNKVMHTPLFKDKVINKPGGNLALYDQDIARTNSDGLASKFRVEHLELKSEYIPEGKIVWRTAGNSAGYANFYTHAVYMANDVDKSKEKKSLGIDVFGNIITNDRKVIVPFYMNPYFINKVKGKMAERYGGKFPSKVSIIPSGVDPKVASYIKDADVPSARLVRVPYNISAFYIDKNGEMVFIQGGPESKKDPGGKIKYISNKDLSVFLSEKGEANNVIDKDETINFIIDVYKDEVRKFYNNCLDVSKSGEAEEGLYAGETDYKRSELVNDPEAKKEDLLGNLLVTVLTGGFGELLRLTIAYTVSDIYEEIFINFSSKYIFHTSYYEDSSMYDNLKGAYVALLIALVAFYIIYSVVHISLGRMAIGDFFKRLAIVVLVSTLPLVVYPRVINLLFNKTTSKVAGNQVNQFMLMDRWALLAREEYDEAREKLPFEISREFRGLDYSYLVKFSTDELQNDFLTQSMLEMNYDEEDIKGRESLKEKFKDKRVNAYIDVNHLFDYFKSEDNDGGLFNYLMSNKSDNYGGFISEGKVYREYGMYVDNEGDMRDESNLLDLGKITGNNEGEGFVRSSDIGKVVFDFYKENDEIDISSRLRDVALYITDGSITNNQKDKILNILADKPLEDIRLSYEELGEEDFPNKVKYNQFEVEKEILSNCGYGDILGVYQLLRDITIVEDDLDVQDKVLRFKTHDITRRVIDYYLQNIWPVKLRSNNQYIDEGAFLEAEQDLIKLRIYFEVSKEFGNKYFPVDLDISKVESDVYVRSLVIPYKDITPDNKGIENAALYVGSHTSAVTLLLFLVMIIFITAYGLIKLVVISTLLLPVLMIMFIWTYIFKRNYESKLWFGALSIILVFAGVHVGFVGLWYFITGMMNRAYSSGLTVGRTSFFNTVTNCVVIAVYFYLVIRYVIVPTIKVASSNISDLGGGHFMGKVMGVMSVVGSRVKDSKLGRMFTRDGESTGAGRGDVDVQGGKVVTEEERRIRELKDSKVSEISGDEVEDKSDSVDSKIEEKKGHIKKGVTKGVRKIGKGLERVNEGMGIGYKTKGKKVKDLRSGGVYVSNVKTQDNKKGVSSFIKEKDPIRRKVMKGFFEDKFETIETDDGLHVKADKYTLKGMSGDLERYMGKKSLGDISIEKINDIADIDYSKYEETGEVTADLNRATLEVAGDMVDSGKLEGYEVIKGEDGKERIKFKADRDTVNDFRTFSSYTNDVGGYGIKGEGVVELGAGNDLVDYYIGKDSFLREGIDYELKDGKYVSKNLKGQEGLRAVYRKAKNSVDSAEERLSDKKELKISDSDGFELDKEVAGRKHYVTYTTYPTKDIMKAIEDIKSGRGEVDSGSLEDRLDMLYSVGEVGEGLLIHTGVDVTNNDVSLIIKDVQKYINRCDIKRKEDLAEKKRKMRDARQRGVNRRNR